MSSSRADSRPARTADASIAAARKVVSGRLELDFAADADGRTYLRHQYASYPFHVCRLQYQDAAIPGLATLYIQSSSGGVYEDDRLTLSMSAGERAQAHLTTQAATIVHSMPMGLAEQVVTIDCQPWSYLEYLPDPQILFPGSAFISKVVVRLGENATALVCDGFLQHDPDGKERRLIDYRSEVAIEDSSGKALAIDRMHIDGDLLGRNIPGVTGAYAAQATFVLARRTEAGDALLRALNDIDCGGREAVIGATMLPNTAGILVRLLAADGAALRRAAHLVWCSIRSSLSGHAPTERRK